MVLHLELHVWLEINYPLKEEGTYETLEREITTNHSPTCSEQSPHDSHEHSGPSNIGALKNSLNGHHITIGHLVWSM
jgi:hypothetical protein